MEIFPMCRICLVENVRMYVVVNKSLQKLYEKLTDVPFVTEDSRPMLACYFCCTILKQCWQFQRKCLEAEELFTQMLNKDYEPNALKERSQFQYFSKFIITPTVHISIFDEDQTDTIAIKEELPADCERLDDIKNVPNEQCLESEEQHESCPDVDDVPEHPSDSDSENDLPLIKVKEKQKVLKKKRKVKEITWAPVDVAKEPTLEDNTTKEHKSKRNIDLAARAEIIALHNQGYNITEIARDTRVSRNTVTRWIRRFKKEGSLQDRQRCGRPCLLNTVQRQTMIKEFEEKGYLHTKHFASLFDTSLLTIRRALRSEGLSDPACTA